mgnify:FL=1
MIEYSLIIIKPDTRERGLEKEIYDSLSILGLQTEKIGKL